MKASKLTSVKSNLPIVFTNWPSSKDNDVYLTVCYWILFDGLVNYLGPDAANKLSNLAREGYLTNPETIRRCRQKLNQDGLFLGNKAVERANQQSEVKQWVKGA